MDRIISGRVWKFGNSINTDIIYPGKYLNITDPVETAKHIFEAVYPDFLKKARPGDIIVAGKYFGCGSSREQAALALKYFGISAVVAESFARIYYRNAINLGLPIVKVDEISTKVKQDEELKIDFFEGIIINLTSGEEIKFQPLPLFILEILKSGGLMPYLKKKLRTETG